MSLNTQGQRFRETDKKSEKESEGKVERMSDLWQKKIKREDLQAGSETFCNVRFQSGVEDTFICSLEWPRG